MWLVQRSRQRRATRHVTSRHGVHRAAPCPPPRLSVDGRSSSSLLRSTRLRRHPPPGTWHTARRPSDPSHSSHRHSRAAAAHRAPMATRRSSPRPSTTRPSHLTTRSRPPRTRRASTARTTRTSRLPRQGLRRPLSPCTRSFRSRAGPAHRRPTPTTATTPGCSLQVLWAPHRLRRSRRARRPRFRAPPQPVHSRDSRPHLSSPRGPPTMHATRCPASSARTMPTSRRAKDRRLGRQTWAWACRPARLLLAVPRGTIAHRDRRSIEAIIWPSR